MCGIFGIHESAGLKVDLSLVNRIDRSMIHRGPDDSGLFMDDKVVLGMRRLAVIDIEGGNQPIFSEDENVVVVCNGEIYNFRALHDRLTRAGHSFRTASDTEVIVHLYEEFGADCVQHLSGMFCFAVWDRRKKRLVLARDRLGIKPLYFTFLSGRLVFASELKSLLEHPDVARRIDPIAVREYLALGYVPAPSTMFQGIRKLEPGSMIIADSGETRIKRYWDPEHRIDASIDEGDWITQIRDGIERAVVSQMISDVPLGAFLSGGIDSSAVVAFMANNSARPVKTYSIGFDADTGGRYYNELPYAREVARRFKTDHHEIVVRPEVTKLLPKLLWHMDEPVADAAFITTYLVSKFAREDVTVILSGVGGDELFGGYRRYWSEHLAQKYRAIPGGIRSGVIRPLSRLLPSDRHSPLLDYLRLAKGFLASVDLPADERYEDYVRVFNADSLAELTGSDPGRRSAALEAAFDASSNADPINRLIEVDLRTQLPDDLLMLTDRMSMATSLECRVPLLDDALVDLALRMPSGLKVRSQELKVGLKKALRGVLPDEIIDRKKRGFGAPIGGWLKHELGAYLDTVLNENTVGDRGIFDWQPIQRMIGLHRANREDYTDHLLAVLNFEIWCRMYLDGQSCDEVADALGANEAA